MNYNFTEDIKSILFLLYHTMDPSQAIERILEAKGIMFDEKMELKRQI